MIKSLSSCIAATGFIFGRAASLFLAAGHFVVGRALDRWVSSRVQRVAFMCFARLNALYSLFAVSAAVCIFALLHPAYTMTPMSRLATAMLLLPAVVLQSMYYRLRPGKASMLVTSCYGRELRVHLPETNLQVRDAAEVRAQVRELVGIAHACRARTLTFRSPLLSAGSTSTLLARQLSTAARTLGVDVSVTIHEPQEVGVVSGGTLSVFARKYAALRAGRLAVGARGRLVSRKVQVSFQ